jgi:hypothetical protein
MLEAAFLGAISERRKKFQGRKVREGGDDGEEG